MLFRSQRHAGLEELETTKPSQWKSRTFMGYAAIFIEVKKCSKLDPFRDPPRGQLDRSIWKFVLNFEDRNDEEKQEMERGLGQSATYAAEVFARQHRHCCYSMTLSGSTARLLRWDRAGAIVSEAFDIRSDSGALHLCQFLWCFANMGDAGRGYDLTVMTSTATERQMYVEAVKAHAVRQMSNFESSEEEALATHYSANAVSVVEVPDSSGDSDAVANGVRRLLVSRPVVYPDSVIGRGTRGYWAVECGTKRVVFLKDTWREDPPPSGKTEGVILSELTKKEVIYVPPLVCHADLHFKDFVMKTFVDGKQRPMLENWSECLYVVHYHRYVMTFGNRRVSVNEDPRISQRLVALWYYAARRQELQSAHQETDPLPYSARNCRPPSRLLQWITRIANMYLSCTQRSVRCITLTHA